MKDLHSSILSTIQALNVPVWFPELTKSLTEKRWENLSETYGIKKSNYSTDGMSRNEPDQFVEVIACLNPTTPVRESLQPLKIYVVPNEIAATYSTVGAIPYSPGVLQDSSILQCLKESVDLLASVPTLYETVANLVRCVHILRPEDDHFDVSYSLPNIPFSIFISVPSKRMANDAIRVAEAILHEAMHLQLTLIERITPMVEETDETYFSPWKNEVRHPRGILHALYVFTVINLFFECLITQDCSITKFEYISSRKKAILSQISGVNNFTAGCKLTESGRLLANRLLAR
ncbi:HEXXH motif-containing putative peptide modification protein [Nitrosospira sp. NRS527]|uniref:aKG-HExxH-type peptide beta-hydroxylase n=1 Tax=Nitrosospira sp. NRS527 TaxID=155925 RepID=UPI001AF37A32|nr:HEXXH motif-containing putative peptide modification protein [Nitrosospira sp. NRS527]BCT69464.1 hypothetical protein NNRS527_03088 [Nitrosospira sp. NRS527]